MTEPKHATFGGGCFWCVEAVLQQVEGVRAVRSGFMGGALENPTYKDICGGDTGHAEVVQVEFDAQVVAYEKLLEWFFRAHDPTTLNRQGNDVGTQYRSVVFYHDDEQRQLAEAYTAQLDASDVHTQPVVTEIAAAETFWVADQGHQDYYRRNREQPYCRFGIAPKLDKLGLDS